jgi:uncharacterized protein (TIGR00290 family)
VHGIGLFWSGGKDSAIALWTLRQLNEPIQALVTTVTETYERVSMHGTRISLLRAQAAALRLPLVEIRIPPQSSNDLYESRVADAFASPELTDVQRYAFGDLFLQDVRARREERLSSLAKRGVWPIWGRDTRLLAEEFIEAGFRAVIVSIDPKQIGSEFCSREFDTTFLRDLPAGVDPCGEQGEFHTFVYDAPLFAEPLDVRRGPVVERGGFYFCDLQLSDFRSD